MSNPFSSAPYYVLLPVFGKILSSDDFQQLGYPGAHVKTSSRYLGHIKSWKL